MSRVLNLAVASSACLALLVVAACADSAVAGWKRAPVVPVLDAEPRAQLLTTLRRGARLGNRADVFIKVGDSHSESAAFAQGLGCQRWSPGGFRRLRIGVRHFSARTLPGASTYCSRVNSLSRNSAATKAWQASYYPLQQGAATDPACATDETPLACEIRLTRPGYALILIGSNDVALARSLGGDALTGFLPNMDAIIRITRALGVVPIVSTIPPQSLPANEAAGQRLNAGLIQLARMRRVPVVNLWRALTALPNQGLSSDGMHLSVFGGPDCVDICDPNGCAPGCQPASFTRAGLRYGYNVRNLTTAVLLNRLAKLSRRNDRRPRAGRGRRHVASV